MSSIDFAKFVPGKWYVWELVPPSSNGWYVGLMPIQYTGNLSFLIKQFFDPKEWHVGRIYGPVPEGFRPVIGRVNDRVPVGSFVNS